MNLRLLQVTIPNRYQEKALELLPDRRVFATKENDKRDGLTSLNLLLRAEQTERVMDRLEEQFGSEEDFHVVLLPVEAALPRSDVEDRPATEPSTGVRISREELYTKVTQGMALSPIFVTMVVLSSVVAAVGLMENNMAAIIGAMVMAPLLGPNVALAFATTLGDTPLVFRSLRTNAIGLASVLLLSAAMGAVFAIDPQSPGFSDHLHVTYADLGLAVAAGVAASISFTSGLAGSVIGVMVAVALIPPLVTCGMLLGAGYPSEALGPFHLTLVNVISINLASVATFLVLGVRPRRLWEGAQAKQALKRATGFWALAIALLVLCLQLSGISNLR